MGYGSQQRQQAGLRAIPGGLDLLHGERQRDAAGIIIFDEDVQDYVQPSTRQGQLMPAAARASKRRSPGPDRFRKAVRPFPEFSAPARHHGGDFGFLRADRSVIVKRWSRCATTATK